MATLRIKRSTTASNVPTSLATGELGINEADGILYYRNLSGVSTALVWSGGAFTGNVTFPAGTTTSPTIVFAGATTSGFSLNSSQLNVVMGGAQRGYMTSTGDWSTTNGTNTLTMNSSTGQFYGVSAAGASPANPTYSFASDSDTGIFNRAANQLGFVCGGLLLAMLRGDATNAEIFLGGANSTSFSPQNVLVRAPTSTGTDIAGAQLRLYGGVGTGAGAGGTIAFWTGPTLTTGTTNHTPVERMRIAATGNVGIGTASPSSTLHVVGSTQFAGPIAEGYVNTGSTGTAQTIALTNGTIQNYTLTGNCTFTMPTATAGQSFTVLLRTGAGSFTATFSGVKWPASTAPTITTTASRMDILTFVSDGTNWYGAAAQNYTP